MKQAPETKPANTETTAPDTSAPVAAASKIQAQLNLPATATEDEVVLAISNLQNQLAAVRTELNTRRGVVDEADEPEILEKTRAGLTRPQATENLRMQRAHAVKA